MARFPDGWVFIPKVSGPKLEDGELVETVSVDDQQKGRMYVAYSDMMLRWTSTARTANGRRLNNGI